MQGTLREFTKGLWLSNEVYDGMREWGGARFLSSEFYKRALSLSSLFFSFCLSLFLSLLEGYVLKQCTRVRVTPLWKQLDEDVSNVNSRETSNWIRRKERKMKKRNKKMRCTPIILEVNTHTKWKTHIYINAQWRWF